MEKIKSILSIAFLSIILSGIFVSCSEDTQEIVNSEENLVINTEQKSQISSIVSEMAQLGEKEGKIINYNISFENGIFKKENIELVSGSEFVNSFAKGFEQNVNSNRGNTTTITCTFPDGSTDSTTCPSNDGTCVGSAVLGCLNSGGCATVCRVAVTYVPSKFK
jgi:hypothetical protein